MNHGEIISQTVWILTEDGFCVFVFDDFVEMGLYNPDTMNNDVAFFRNQCYEFTANRIKCFSLFRRDFLGVAYKFLELLIPALTF